MRVALASRTAGFWLVLVERGARPPRYRRSGHAWFVCARNFGGRGVSGRGTCVCAGGRWWFRPDSGSTYGYLLSYLQYFYF
ncbi:hypothetical protein BDZ94DRAFT_1263179 [Collybia nuda]|uniref:Uncharacterized protein n=1 Tax=Collybia nuda TaxID=64659 RepID=A0A9P6CDG6_9AGAR|nr:hypothetical protein BDZ94DRAFT_1263179 [Collybia nuda]